MEDPAELLLGVAEGPAWLVAAAAAEGFWEDRQDLDSSRTALPLVVHRA